MTLLLLACVASDDTLDRPPRKGPKGPDDTEEIEDNNEPPVDTGPEDTGEPIDVGPATDEVCYLGSDRSGDACLAVVDWDPAWGSDYDYPDPYNGSSQYAKPLRFVDLAEADPDLALAPNFVLDEFMQEWKGRFAIYQPHAVERMQELRDAVGGPVTVNSGYRNVAYNDGVGGAEYSRHMYGDACDMRSSSASLTRLGEICEDLGAGYIGYYESHIHCDWRNDPLEPAFFESGRSGNPDTRPELSAALIERDGVLEAPAEGWDEGEPLREWAAFGPGGEMLVEQTSRTFEAPDEAASIEVVVGRALVLNIDLD